VPSLVARIKRLFPWLDRRYVRRAVVLLVASLGLTGLTSSLALLAGDRINFTELHMGGQEASSYWQDAANDQPVTVNSRTLELAVKSHQLVATYTLALPAGSPLVHWLAKSPAHDGDDFVRSLLGSVAIGEFAYGVSGPNVTWTYLDFAEPRLRVDRSGATVTVESTPYAPSLDRVHLSVDGTDANLLVKTDQVIVPSRDGRVREESALSLVSAGQKSVLRRDAAHRARLTFARDAGYPWLTWVRDILGRTIPVLDPTLSRLDELILIAVFLWALSAGAQPDDLLPRAARLVLGGFAAVAVIGLTIDPVVALNRANESRRGALLAGPFGLLLAALVFVWPVLCAGAERAERPRWRLLVPFAFIPIYAVCLALFSGVSAAKTTVLVAAAFVVVGLTLVVLYETFGATPPWIPLLGVPATLLSAINLWPLAYWSYYRPGFVAHVNAQAKWFYLVGGLAAVTGLCVLAGRLTIPVRWRVAAILAIALSAVPSLLLDARPWDSHSVGRTVIDLFGLFDGLSSLVEWLMLGFIALSLFSLVRRREDTRAAVRRHGIAAGLLVFFADDRLLYVPVSRLIGLVLLVLVLLPAELSRRDRPTAVAQHRLHGVLGAWRLADLAKQRIESIQ
jgi:hypothetical protein